jgi:hypothetical protein
VGLLSAIAKKGRNIFVTMAIVGLLGLDILGFVYSCAPNPTDPITSIEEPEPTKPDLKKSDTTFTFSSLADLPYIAVNTQNIDTGKYNIIVGQTGNVLVDSAQMGAWFKAYTDGFRLKSGVFVKDNGFKTSPKGRNVGITVASWKSVPTYNAFGNTNGDPWMAATLADSTNLRANGFTADLHIPKVPVKEEPKDTVPTEEPKDTVPTDPKPVEPTPDALGDTVWLKYNFGDYGSKITDDKTIKYINDMAKITQIANTVMGPLKDKYVIVELNGRIKLVWPEHMQAFMDLMRNDVSRKGELDLRDGGCIAIEIMKDGMEDRGPPYIVKFESTFNSLWERFYERARGKPPNTTDILLDQRWLGMAPRVSSDSISFYFELDPAHHGYYDANGKKIAQAEFKTGKDLSAQPQTEKLLAIQQNQGRAVRVEQKNLSNKFRALKSSFHATAITQNGKFVRGRDEVFELRC